MAVLIGQEWFTMGSELGEGTFGKVHQITAMETSEQYALKMVKRKQRDEDTGEEIDNEMMVRTEVELMKKLKGHENIVAFCTAAMDNDNFYILMQMCTGGTLADICGGGIMVDEVLVINYFIQLVTGCEYMHERGIIHRDLKPANIFFLDNSHMLLKIGDFGLAIQCEDGQRSIETDYFCGTVCYSAPETFNRPNSRYSSQSDLYSIACIMDEVSTGRQTFYLYREGEAIDEGNSTIRKRICDRDFVLRRNPSVELASLLEELLNFEPEDRPVASDLLEILAQHLGELKAKKALEKSEELPAAAVKKPRPATVAAMALNRTMRLFRCEKNGCCIAFTTKAALEEHQRKRHMIKAFLCEQAGCGRRFVRKRDMWRHFRLKHSGDGDRPFVCDQCARAFGFKAHLLEHIVGVHQRLKPHQCPECRRRFSLKSNLTAHRRTHHAADAKTVACPHCGRSFGQLKDMKEHRDYYCRQNPAKRQRPFACPQCAAAFTRKAFLNNHLRAIHGLTEADP